MALDQIDVDQIGEAEDEMSFLEHLEELRKHIIKALLAMVIVGTVFFLFHQFIFEQVVLGPLNESFWTYKFFCSLGETFCFGPPNVDMIAVGVGQPFILSIKVSFILGFIAAFPYVFYQFWSFVKPGLMAEEVGATRGIIFICSFLFLIGVSFGYFVISPFASSFLLNYSLPGVTNTPTITSFISYMIMFTLPAGLIFELPIVVYFLAKVGVVTPEAMRKYRKHAMVGILILAAVITPPDVVTQFLIGVPLYILYELSIFVAARETKKYKKSLD